MDFTDPRTKKMFLIGLLAVSIVTIILGLGLGLGMQTRPCPDTAVPLTSCRNICYQPFDDEIPGCRCDAGCGADGTCCHDFHDLCLVPTQQWGCTKLRCGEKRLADSKCHCSNDCLAAGDCCTDYKHVCHGESQWVEDQCEDLASPKCPPGFKRQPLLLVSLDGLRAEYLRTWSSVTPVLDKMKTCGTSAPYMQAAFPSKTFPNHYTIVTGLYPESNGLIDNSMYDPVMDASFSLSSPEKDNPAWYLGQPIWHTASFQGLKSGTFFWPGSDVKINGSHPDMYRPYNGKVPYEERVFTVLKWLQLPDEQRPDFFTLYLEEPDKSGHKYGPVSGQVIKALGGVDKIMGQLMNGLKQMGLERCLNVLVVSDHGMEATSCERVEALQELVGDVRSLWVYEGPFGRIRAKDKNQQLDREALVANMTCKRPQQKIKPYLKAHLPKRFHYANSRRIEDVNVLVEPGWLFERYPKSLHFCSGGAHGYDNDVESMHAIFLSYGPKFQPKTEIQPFSNIELYNLMCDVLEISPADNNGTHGSMNHALRNPRFTPKPPTEQTLPEQCPLLTLSPADLLGCSCPGLDIIASNSRLNLTAAQALVAAKTHMPFGRPRLLQRNQSYCLFHQEDFVSGFSHTNLMPLWSSFTIKSTMDFSPPRNDCLRPDVRIPPPKAPRCDLYAAAGNLTHGFLYPPGWSVTAEQQNDALLTSNMAPMFPEFKKMWDYFQGVLLKKYASVYNGINVVTGPAFDFNYDGRYDAPEEIQRFLPNSRIPVPTHYFTVLTSCRDASQPAGLCGGELQTVAFLLPHRPSNSESCESSQPEPHWVEDLVWFHQSRVRDVEWITGLDFYRDSERPVAELLRMKTRPTAANHRPL